MSFQKGSKTSPNLSVCWFIRENKAQVKKVCDIFLDKDIIEQSDLVDALENDDEFENLLKQAIEY